LANAPTLVNPVVGTQSPGDNTTKAASTAFVTAAVVASTTGVAFFNGRTGAVLPAGGDYTEAQITPQGGSASPACTSGQVGALCTQTGMNGAAATATFTNSSSTIGWTANGLQVNDEVFFTTTGGLPTNFSASTNYFVVSQATNSITVSSTLGGAAIVAGSAGTGTQTGHAAATIGSGSTINIASLSLPAGDWTCTANISEFVGTGTTINSVSLGISTTFDTLPAAGAFGGHAVSTPLTISTGLVAPTGEIDVNSVSAQWVYAVILSGFSGGTAAAGAAIRCRRAS
jgi:hypothetical protein